MDCKNQHYIFLQAKLTPEPKDTDQIHSNSI